MNSLRRLRSCSNVREALEILDQSNRNPRFLAEELDDLIDLLPSVLSVLASVSSEADISLAQSCFSPKSRIFQTVMKVASNQKYVFPLSLLDSEIQDAFLASAFGLQTYVKLNVLSCLLDPSSLVDGDSKSLVLSADEYFLVCFSFFRISFAGSWRTLSDQAARPALSSRFWTSSSPPASSPSSRGVMMCDSIYNQLLKEYLEHFLSIKDDERNKRRASFLIAISSDLWLISLSKPFVFVVSQLNSVLQGIFSSLIVVLELVFASREFHTYASTPSASLVSSSLRLPKDVSVILFSFLNFVKTFSLQKNPVDLSNGSSSPLSTSLVRLWIVACSPWQFIKGNNHNMNQWKPFINQFIELYECLPSVVEIGSGNTQYIGTEEMLKVMEILSFQDVLEVVILMTGKTLLYEGRVVDQENIGISNIMMGLANSSKFLVSWKKVCVASEIDFSVKERVDKIKSGISRSPILLEVLQEAEATSRSPPHSPTRTIPSVAVAPSSPRNSRKSNDWHRPVQTGEIESLLPFTLWLANLIDNNNNPDILPNCEWPRVLAHWNFLFVFFFLLSWVFSSLVFFLFAAFAFFKYIEISFYSS